ncbi:MAG: hypothetical protein ACJASY_004200 [Halioglobus sp.]|jgi:hypothetical protein
MKRVLAATFIFWLNSGVQAANVPLIDLQSAVSCNGGATTNGVQLSDVTGDDGGATDCWGTYNGNDPKQNGFTINGGDDTYSFVSKWDVDQGGVEAGSADIGLEVSVPQGVDPGSWKFNEDALMGHDFLIVLKASNEPGFAVWLFSGPEALSFAGTWAVAWAANGGNPNNADQSVAGLSHLSIYKGPGDEPNTQVPVPATLLLFGAGLLAIRILKRKR